MRLLSWAISVLTALTLAAGLAAGGPLFTLAPPDGALAGQPGQTLVWGLTIQNDDSGWVVITSTTFDQTTSIGDFTDLLTPQFFASALPPNQSTSTSLGSYAIDGSFASPGDMATGFLDLFFDIHSIDPNGPEYDPENDTVSGSQAQLPGSVTYQAAPEVPEPASIGTALAGLALLVVVRARGRRRLSITTAR